MAEFTYNNTKNAGLGHILFQLNCGFYLKVSYKKNINAYSKSKAADKLAKK